LKLKTRLKILPDTLVLDLVPKTEPIMIAPMHRIANRHIGIVYLFLRYQGRLVNATKIATKNTIRKRYI